VRERRADPLVYAGLVHACRYCGLLDQSIAAHRHARRLDPTATTSVLHTYYMRGDYALALEEGHNSSDPFEARVLAAMGRELEAIEAARREEERFSAFPLVRGFCTALRAALEGRPDDALPVLAEFRRSGFNDGEGLFYLAEIYARLGLLDEGLATLAQAVDMGFVAVLAIDHDRHFDRLRHCDEYPGLVGRAAARQSAAAEAFLRNGGPNLLAG
jgi:tetratricopeptide (TPR) repeat protein